jgi:NADPH2:quinone reductase
MTEPRVNHAFRLRRRPEGNVTGSELAPVIEDVPALQPGQALVRTKYLSLDPSTRIWMSDHEGYLPPVPIDAVMRGLGLGEVVESARDDMKVGDHVMGWTGWQEYCVADDGFPEGPFSVLPNPLPAPLSAFLGALGHTGITAYLGVDIGRPEPGQTMVVSAAAGAVGSIAGQIGKARGARVVGLAGGAAKCRHVVEHLGFDACVDYRADDWREQLDAATPDGVDVDFENVGGEIMDHVLARLNIGARIALSGMIATYNEYGSGSGATQGQLNIGQLIMKRATMTGFLVLDHGDRFGEAVGYLAGLLAEGKLKYDETIVDGLDKAPEAVNQLFSGKNTGKLLIRVA